MRRELKYVCSEHEMALIKSGIERICTLDSYAVSKGSYRVRSVYFDSYENTYFYENENGVEPREKFRLRIYDGDFSNITLECKQKLHGCTQKEQCKISREMCSWMLDRSFGNHEEILFMDMEADLLRRFFLNYKRRQLRAKVIIEYERVPFVYQIGNVRVTFDRFISGSSDVQFFLEPDISLKPIMPMGRHVLEVKYDELLPDYIHNAIQAGKLKQSTYSNIITVENIVDKQGGKDNGI